jgi:hypothetical protein
MKVVILILINCIIIIDKKKYKLKSFFSTFNIPLVYFSQKLYIKFHKYVDDIHNKYLL